MKSLWMLYRAPGETEPNQDAEWAVVQACREKGLEMPPVQQGWFKGGLAQGEFSSEKFPGASPIWYWEAK